MSEPETNLPIVIIGAGPVGLSAAAQLAKRGRRFLVLEAGPSAGHAIEEWGHVQLFSPWRYCIDPAAGELLTMSGWNEPDPDTLPTGAQLVSEYLRPLSQHSAIAPFLRTRAKVVKVTRQGADKVRSEGRASLPFEIVVEGGERVLASAVIDATGTWGQPNPAGANGVAADGESAAEEHIRYGLPDILGADRQRYAGKRTLVIGSGHSAINDVLSLLQLRQSNAGTEIAWSLRRVALEKVYGGEQADALPARGALGSRARSAIESGDVRLLAPFQMRRIAAQTAGLKVEGDLDGQPASLEVDEIIVATGFRPDLAMLSELRLSLDPALESSGSLGPMIDPNLHSCGTVPPHGYRELMHAEPGFFIAGSKSYGRAPTFLMATGFEQVRSIAAHLDGDEAAASRVELILPETGVCSSDGGSACCSSSGSTSAADACCGGSPTGDASACCVLDEQAKASGLDGCGCGTDADVRNAPSFVSLASF